MHADYVDGLGDRQVQQFTALDAAMSSAFHVGRQWRGASEFLRSL
jgi:hypothetical protein